MNEFVSPKEWCGATLQVAGIGYPISFLKDGDVLINNRLSWSVEHSFWNKRITFDSSNSIAFCLASYVVTSTGSSRPFLRRPIQSLTIEVFWVLKCFWNTSDSLLALSSSSSSMQLQPFPTKPQTTMTHDTTKHAKTWIAFHRRTPAVFDLFVKVKALLTPNTSLFVIHHER